MEHRSVCGYSTGAATANCRDIMAAVADIIAAAADDDNNDHDDGNDDDGRQ